MLVSLAQSRRSNYLQPKQNLLSNLTFSLKTKENKYLVTGKKIEPYFRSIRNYVWVHFHQILIKCKCETKKRVGSCQNIGLTGLFSQNNQKVSTFTYYWYNQPLRLKKLFIMFAYLSTVPNNSYSFWAGLDTNGHIY